VRKQKDKFLDAMYSDGEELAAEKPKEPLYIKFCKYSYKYFGKNAKKELTEKYKVALAFLDWDIEPQELNSAPLFAMTIGIMLSFLWALLNYVFYNFFRPIELGGATLIGYAPELGLPLMIYLLPFAGALGLGYYIQAYPLKAAEKEKIKSLRYIPEIVNYIVMSMKVSPNLERAIRFAAEHGHGRIAKDFRKLHYDIQIGKYKTVEEALDYLAWKWGEYSEEFKHALMLIRSSVMEIDEGKRNNLLDKAVEDTLAGVKDKMDMYSRAMHQPSIYLYYFGVLLPLLLVIIIPVGSMMAADTMGFLATPAAMILMYNIAIPAVSLLLAKSILEKKPPTRPVPKIPDNLPGLPKKGWFSIGSYQLPIGLISLGILASLVIAGFALEPVLNPKPPAYMTAGRDVEHLPIVEYAGIALGFVWAASFYIWASNKDKRKAQLELIRMEDEFQDTLYVLASRLGEGKPMEEALKHSAEFLPNSPTTKKIFIPTLQNVTVMGMTLKMALFDKAYGSLKYIPSDFIRGTMRIVVESLTLGVQTAARSLVSLSLQLQDSQKVERSLRALLEDITSMMSIMSTLIAPVVLGITIALQKVIYSALGSAAGNSALKNINTAGIPGVGMVSPMLNMNMGAKLPAIDQTMLLAIITIYMIEIVLVLIYFASSVTEGDNKLAFKINASIALPISLTIFFAIAFFATKLIPAGI